MKETRRRRLLWPIHQRSSFIFGSDERAMGSLLLLCLFLLSMPLPSAQQSNFNEGKFNSLIQKLESDVIEFARQLEFFHSTRCIDFANHSLAAECTQGNYDDCQSLYPNQQCLAGESHHVPACGELSARGSGCSGLVDFSLSTVRIPSALVTGEYQNPTDPLVVETVCYTAAMDAWLQAKRAADEDYWNEFGVAPWAWYFGSHTGVMRMWPGRQGVTCGQFDPRVRPWYVAASSGPKNVVMVLDTSGSMSGLKMTQLKEAAKRVVNTLTVADRVAIVPFDDVANPITDESGNVYTATQVNKDILLEEIDKLEANGRTNFYDAFTSAFDILDRSARDEVTVDCNTAILFLTDGEMTEPENVTETDVLNLVSERITRTSQSLSKPILLFTYSVSNSDNVHELPKQLACAHDWGVWSAVTAEDNIVDSLSSYYRLFALGSGVDENFLAWVEPYVYDPGETFGTSVAIPVYDRSTSPPLFLGVAAIDVSMAALDLALGIEPGRGSEESIKRVALVSTARCPALELGLCELESFRRRGSSGDDGLCSANCTTDDYVPVQEEKCPYVNDYPTNLWKDVENAGKAYEDRVCCVVGESFPSDQCPASNSDEGDTAMLVGAIVGAVGFVICAGLCCWCWTPVEDDDDTVKASSAAPGPPILVSGPAVSQPQSSGIVLPGSVTVEPTDLENLETAREDPKLATVTE